MILFTLFLYFLYSFIFRKTVATETAAMAWALFIYSIHLLHLLYSFIYFIKLGELLRKTDSGGARGPEAGPGALLTRQGACLRLPN